MEQGAVLTLRNVFGLYQWFSVAIFSRLSSMFFGRQGAPTSAGVEITAPASVNVFSWKCVVPVAKLCINRRRFI